VQRSQQAVLKNAHLTLRLVAGVAPRQVWQVTPMISNLGYTPLGEHDVQVPLGDLDAVEGKAILVELLVPARRPGRYRLAQTEVTYDIPLLGLRGASVRAPIVVDYTSDQNLTSRYNPRIMNIVERVTAFKLQTRALQEAEMGDIAGATRKLRAAATRLLELGEQDLATAATTEADNLERSGHMSSGGSKRLRYQTRKLTQKLPDLPDEDQDA
jgi:Ca-activated chloride channel family protein